MNAYRLSGIIVAIGIALFVTVGCGPSTPLATAARAGDLDRVKGLLDNSSGIQADVNAKEKSGYTALHYAAFEGYAPIAQVLLDHGANVNALDSGGLSPLLIAAQRGYPDVVVVLVTHGADVNIKDKNNWTPLMYAAQGGYIEMVKALVGAGADVNWIDKSGSSAVALAHDRSHEDVVDFLTGKNKSIESRSIHALAAPLSTRPEDDSKNPTPAKPSVDDLSPPKKVNAVPAD